LEDHLIVEFRSMMAGGESDKANVEKAASILEAAKAVQEQASQGRGA
jgi:hypothetical protein